jgi:hypothetical protein
MTTVRLHYPENPKSDNQVILSEFIHKGWDKRWKARGGHRTAQHELG